MPDARREPDFGNFSLRGGDAYLFAVKIVAVFHLPGEVQVMLILLKIKGKSLVSRDKLRAAWCVK